SSNAGEADEALLDADPLVWRAIHLRVYDRSGAWRRTIFVAALVFAALVASGFVFVGMSFIAVGVIMLVVFLATSAAPIQWLIDERKSGWFAELQLTPIPMEEVLDASIRGTVHHLKPLWIVAAIALSLNQLHLFLRDPPNAVL